MKKRYIKPSLVKSKATLQAVTAVTAATSGPAK